MIHVLLALLIVTLCWRRAIARQTGFWAERRTSRKFDGSEFPRQAPEAAAPAPRAEPKAAVDASVEAGRTRRVFQGGRRFGRNHNPPPATGLPRN